MCIAIYELAVVVLGTYVTLSTAAVGVPLFSSASRFGWLRLVMERIYSRLCPSTVIQPPI